MSYLSSKRCWNVCWELRTAHCVQTLPVVMPHATGFKRRDGFSSTNGVRTAGPATKANQTSDINKQVAACVQGTITPLNLYIAALMWKERSLLVSFHKFHSKTSFHFWRKWIFSPVIIRSPPFAVSFFWLKCQLLLADFSSCPLLLI